MPFLAHSHTYPGFIGKMSSLDHFLLDPRCEDYSFQDQAVSDFEQSLDSILTDFIETPGLQNIIHPLISHISLVHQSHQGFSTELVLFLILLNHSLLLTLDLINYGASLGHFFHLYLWPADVST